MGALKLPADAVLIGLFSVLNSFIFYSCTFFPILQQIRRAINTNFKWHSISWQMIYIILFMLL